MIEPPKRQWLPEVTGLLRELTRLPRLSHELACAPRGQGAVLALPGFLTGDWATVVLRRALGQAGYEAHPWGLGRNDGDLRRLVPAVQARAEALADAGGPIALVGWSHGGVLAREVARSRPELVSRVVTLGTPVVGGPKYTAVAHRYQHLDLDALEEEIARRARARPLQVPVTAIYTRRDCVVAWQACIDPIDRAEHVEVDTTHAGLVLNAEALGAMLQALGQQADRETG